MTNKFLSVLGVDESTQKMLPKDIMDSAYLLNGLQKIYANSPESPKKDQLALAISESVKMLLAEIQKYKSSTSQVATTSSTTPTTTMPPAPQPKPQPKPSSVPKAPKPSMPSPPQPPTPPTPPNPPPLPSPHQEEPMTCEEIKDAIKGLTLIAKMGDSEAKEIVKKLKIKLKTQNCK